MRSFRRWRTVAQSGRARALVRREEVDEDITVPGVVAGRFELAG
jgi:hypothetical protein